MKKHLVRLMALLLAASMLAACGSNSVNTAGSTETTSAKAADVSALEYPVTPDELGSGEVKWSEEKTADGWMKVTNDGGDTLGYSPDSGVTLIQVDGYAFKDLNRNGLLDEYEDWRVDDSARAEDLAGQMAVEDIIGLMVVPATSSLEADGSNATLQNTLGETTPMTVAIEDGLRQILSRGSSMPALSQARWNNNMQTAAEKVDAYGIPVQIWTDPRTKYTAGLDNLALAATFDTELVKQAVSSGNEKYRALGITGLYAPQIDVASEPRWSRVSGTFGEDPALSRDMTNAVISAMQSTYDENGDDLGWGEDSVIAVMKHWPSDAPGEGGREAHNKYGKYNVYPGDAFMTGLIPFVDGGLNLDSATGMAGGVMTSYSIAYTADESLGELVGSAFSEYKIDLLRSYGYDDVIVTDSSVTSPASERFTTKDHGVENLTVAEKDYKAITAGVDQILASNNYGEQNDVAEAYQMYVDEYGQEAADARFQESARRILRNEFRAGIFENAYVDCAAAAAIVDENTSSAELATTAGNESVVMLKNSDNTIQESTADEKPTVYIPMVYSPAARTPAGTTPASWSLPISESTASEYFNVVTDTVGNPTGKAGDDGQPTYTTKDIIRASKTDLKECDYALLFLNSPSTGKGYDSSAQKYIPISLQYGEYTANSEKVRVESISGDLVESLVDTPYGVISEYVKENRSYCGESTVASNLYELEALLDVTARLPENLKVIVCVDADRPMIFSEFEEQVDAILIDFGVSNDIFLDIVTGKVEPSGLLPIQMPANMETVEAQYEDVPRDMECYVDSEGNTYDFAFGLNWSGVISDERTAKYNVAPLTEPATQPVNG